MKTGIQVAGEKQIPLDLGIEVQKDINGIEMGVLGNGIPYLTQRGLSGVTGVNRSVIQAITKEWEEQFENPIIGKDRNSFLKQHLFKNGYNESKLHLETVQNGVINYAYPDVVCMALLEYYAFESKSDNKDAVENYRRFAAYGLRKFIYDSLEYTPEDKWKYHHDRISLLKDSTPIGYFTIFQETTGLIVDLISADLTVNNHTVADISIGQHWGKYWKENSMESQFGARIPYEHNYPSYYPQAASNPQAANAYPDSALPVFRQWFRQEYLPTKFPKYILTKANILPGDKDAALQIGNMYQPKKLQN
ncbi:hypothetical protein [Acidovorax sp. NCPPB 3576]|uniref:hypothetical protein n=1 Tax=Acidovorax sp. NCPPB 3576 TaxID=2940488 RepID=UPI00234AD99C|nr:hypothetical protein [Acidovorax sp. NCPPB 3576]WCM86677.1 hypothetical protein M5C98_14955 [Acidovorax sp. NCPPB 3576]